MSSRLPKWIVYFENIILLLCAVTLAALMVAGYVRHHGGEYLSLPSGAAALVFAVTWFVLAKAFVLYVYRKSGHS